MLLSITKRSQGWQEQQVVPHRTSPSWGQQLDILSPFGHILKVHVSAITFPEIEIKSKTKNIIKNIFFIYFYAPGRTRTLNLLFRRQTCYPLHYGGVNIILTKEVEKNKVLS